LSSIDQPAHGNFILAPSAPYDWRSPQNTNLWQGVNGVNNPCPSGYRIPTETEINAERLSWSVNNSAGAFASPLKLPVAGNRLYSNGSLVAVGAHGNYWSSTVNGTSSPRLYFDGSNAAMYNDARAYGISVRCIKDAAATPQYPAGTVNCAAGATAVVDVTNPTTGQIWMDRNLGATQVATSSTDVNSYGDLYQWGRGSDGHQCRTSPTTSTLSSIDQPAHGDFILTPTGSAGDWRSPQNVNLWQGVNGVNNPCPSGYRLPTETEINAERLSWSTNNAAGAFASPLKLTLAGGRAANNGSLYGFGTGGRYWSSTVSVTGSRLLSFGGGGALFHDDARAYGLTVRCLKD
jgi:hypothetical protein